MAIDHQVLFTICKQLPTDYTDYGGQVVRWADEAGYYPDCSCGCKWALWLAPPFSADWCVCARPDGPRCGLLTFEHMTGNACFEADDAAEDDTAVDLPTDR